MNVLQTEDQDRPSTLSEDQRSRLPKDIIQKKDGVNPDDLAPYFAILLAMPSSNVLQCLQKTVDDPVCLNGTTSIDSLMWKQIDDSIESLETDSRRSR